MEQRLETSFLNPGPMERAGALGLGAVGIGMGVLLAAWGVSLIWRDTPHEIRIANPEVTIKQNGPLTVQQDKPFTIQPPEPLKVQIPPITINPGLPFPPPANSGGGSEPKTPTGEVIKREVTVFWTVDHGLGTVVTGWKYPDGRGGTPVSEFCYYSVPNLDGSFKRVNIAHDRVPSASVSGLVPDFNLALTKCQWS